MKTYTIKEWNEKPILKKSIFNFMFLKKTDERIDAVFKTEDNKYLLSTQLYDDHFDIKSNMTADDIYLESKTLTIEQLY